MTKFKYDLNLDDRGFYKVGNQIFYSKILAILESTRTHQELRYVMHDDAYGKLNWAAEPEESLDQLYAARAWEIRNQYDYLVLHFSGGSDSTNILETFIKNKIPLDCVYLRGAYAKTNNNIKDTSDTNITAETYLNALPIANEVKERFMPNLNIVMKETSQYVVDYFANNPNWYDIERNQVVSNLNILTFGRSDPDAVHPEFRKLSESGKRVGHILGLEKPMVYHDGNNYFVKFLDSVYNVHMTTRQTDLDVPLHTVPFYWAPSTGKIIIKQSHAIKNFIKKHNINFTRLFDKGRVSQDFIANIIYRRTLPLYFQAEKPAAGLITSCETEFLKDSSEQYVKNWVNGVEEIDKIIPDQWKHNGTIYNGIVGCFTKSYYIGS